MATLAQIEEGIRRANAKGDLDAVRKLGAAYRSLQNAAPVEAAPEVNMNVASRFAAMPQNAPAEDGVNPLQRFGQSMYSTVTGATQGATMGAYDEIASLLGTPIKGAENLLTGQDSINGMGDILPFLGRSLVDARQGQNALTDMAFEQAPAAYIAGDFGGSLGTGIGLAGRGVTTFGEVARPTVAGMFGRGLLEGGVQGAASGYNDAPDDTLGSRLTSAATGAGVGAAIGGISGGVLGGLAGRAQTAAIPTVKELEDQAGAIYDAARASGVTASPQMSQGIANTIEGIAKSENIILPKSGKVDASYPKIAGILDVFKEYSGEPLDVGRLQAIRRRIQDAAKSADPGERRIATIMLGEFDDFATNVSPELAEASNIYWKAKTGEMIDQAIELADNRSGQYSQSGMENALRTQFRQLNAQIIKGRVKGITPELADQISLVADGAPIQNFARWAGKFATRGPVSALPTILAGGSGFALGGPVGAALATGAVALPAELGKFVAEKTAIRNADIASALARSGGALPSWNFSPASGGIVQGAASSVARALSGG